MQWLTFRYGLLLGMGKHCPARRLKRLAPIMLLVAAALIVVVAA